MQRLFIPFGLCSNLLNEVKMYVKARYFLILVLDIIGRRGSFLRLHPPERRAALMTTMEVLTLCLVVIGICGLFIQANKKWPPAPWQVRRSLQNTFKGWPLKTSGVPLCLLLYGNDSLLSTACWGSFLMMINQDACENMFFSLFQHVVGTKSGKQPGNTGISGWKKLR